MADETRLRHPFAPVFDADSRILLLGSFPSVKSRRNQFYYGNPQNRFWKVLAALTHEDLPGTIEEKTTFLLRNRIALWDVILECDIVGSSDRSIRNVVPSDVAGLLAHTRIRSVYANGAKAYELYDKYLFGRTGRPCQKLPSTSPANAAYSLERLVAVWKEILKDDL